MEFAESRDLSHPETDALMSLVGYAKPDAAKRAERLNEVCITVKLDNIKRQNDEDKTPKRQHHQASGQC